MINQNYEKLLQLKLDKMAELYLNQLNTRKYSELPFDERMAILIDGQLEDSRNKAIELLRKKANLRIADANLSDIDFFPDRQIDKVLTLKLFECDFIREKLNVIVTGSTGAGKTYYVSALANAAINRNIRTRYIRLPDLLYEINAFRSNPKSFKIKMKTFSNYDLLIIDDWLISPLSETQQSDIFELLELRSDNRSTVLSSQFETSGWISRLGENAISDAIMDRVIHSSYIINIKGDKSMRERKMKL